MMMRLANLMMGTIAAMLLVACAVGPDFKRPESPKSMQFTETPVPEKTASADTGLGASQRFVPGQLVPGEWWKLFGSEALNRIVQKALAANPDLLAAKAALRQAQENAYAQAGTFLPSVDLNASPTREKFNGAAFGQPGIGSSIFTLYNASVSASYTLDVFGGERRALEAYKAQADYAKFEMEAAYLTLTANVVTAAIQEASLRAQIQETQHIIDIEQHELKVLNAQFTLGGIAKTSVLEQQTTLAQTQATLPPLEKQLARQRHQLAVFTGGLPGDGLAETFDLASLHLPENLPVSLPSKLVEQRPDIQASSALLHAASAEVGVATANMLPQITLSASYGWETTHLRDLFTSGSNVWSIGGGLLQPLFRGGSLLHERRAAQAGYDKAAANYQSTVLLAFENVADSLRALQYDADALVAVVNAEKAASQGLDLAREQYKDGAITYPQLLDVERSYQQARISLVQAQALRLADTAALFQSLGGGWENRTPDRDAKPALASEKK